MLLFRQFSVKKTKASIAVFLKITLILMDLNVLFDEL